MQLIYAWIDEYRNMSSIGINFSSQFTVTFDPSITIKKPVKKESRDKKIYKDCHISIAKSNEYIPNFFGTSIKEISAIIGKNGTGKSNILDFLCTSIVSGRRNLLGRYFFIFEDNNEFFIWNKLDIIYNKPKITAKIFNRTELKKSEDPEKYWDCVFYSNVSDGRELSFDGNDKVCNLSYETNRKNQANKIDYLLDLYSRKKSPGAKLSSVETRLDMDNLLFECTIESEKLISDSFKKDFLYENYECLKGRYYRALLTSDTNALHYALIYSVFTYLFSLQYKREVKQKLDSEIIEEILDHEVIQDLKVNTILGDDDKSKFNQHLLKKYNINVIDLILYQVLISEDSKGKVAEQPINILNPIVYKFIKLIDIKLFDKKFKIWADILNLLEITYPQKNEISKIKKEEGSSSNRIIFKFNDHLISKLDDYCSIFNEIKIIKHDWAKLSSGMKAYLNLFSNIFANISKVKNKNVLICIDEGDLYFHPEMQRCFLNDIMGFINRIFIDKNVQLILTSHSPFLVADLPKENLILLKNIQDSDGKEKVVNYFTEKNTFGSNIYMLFNKHFFLEDGTLGEFANSKLNQILHRLTDKKSNLNAEDIDSFMTIIDKIGDDMIRLKMHEIIIQNTHKLTKEGLEQIKQWHHDQLMKIDEAYD